MTAYRSRGWLHPLLATVGGVVCLASALLPVVFSTGASAAPAYSQENGGGSSYAANAFSQWQTDAFTLGVPVNYTASSSPQGLGQYQSGILPFAGSEADYGELNSSGSQSNPPQGWQYTPDVAGAVAVMYNVQDQAGRQINYLHLTQKTVARIFLGLVTNWDSPEISAENRGMVLPNNPIVTVGRANQSGTTALFFDFVQHADPADFATWSAAHHIPPDPLEVDFGGVPGLFLNGSDLEVERVQGQPWTIGYDEFSYPKAHGVPVAWVQNASGSFTQPYAQNISAALESAKLNPIDYRQDLSGVYTSTNPLTYPISAYSYLVTQCYPTTPTLTTAPTCKTPYADPGAVTTLSTWMAYIACAGQVKMAVDGYAPLPTNLSQDLSNASGFVAGQAPTQLSPANCSDPTWVGQLGVGSVGPPDPYLSLASVTNPVTTTLPPSGPGGGVSTTTIVAHPGAASPGSHSSIRTAAGSGASPGSGLPSGQAQSVAPGDVGPLAQTVGVGRVGGVSPVGGGNGQTRSAAPVSYKSPIPGGLPGGPLAVLLLVLVVPPLLLGIRRRSREV